jgi:hypothetical protein
VNPLLTNLHIYRSIAEEAHADAQQLDAAAKTPKADGSQGYVIALDPHRRSFKQSQVAIAFSGVYFEALLFLKGTQRMGKRWLREFDRKTYEGKLLELGVANPSLVQAAKRLREVRRDLIHEKATPVLELGIGSTYWAQSEAAAAIAFIREVSVALENAP